MKKKDPYLSELDKIGELEGEEPTRVDLNPPKAEKPPSEEIETEPTPATEAGGAAAPGAAVKGVLDLAPDIPVQVVVVMGRKNVTVKDLLSLRMGQVIDFDRVPTEAVDLVAAGKVIGKGELVEVNGKLGIRILKLLK